MEPNRTRVERATKRDFEALGRLLFESHTLSFATFASEEWLSSRRLDEYIDRWRTILESADDDDATFVSRHNGAIVGSVRVHRIDDPRYDAQLANMHVSPELTGQGLGSLLMDAALGFISEQDFSRVNLGVIAANSDARRFYEAHGWKVAEERPDGVEGVPIAIYELIMA